MQDEINELTAQNAMKAEAARIAAAQAKHADLMHKLAVHKLAVINDQLAAQRVQQA